ANPGAFIPIALKDISELNPSAGEYVVNWLFFTIVSLLPLAIALLLVVVAPERARRWLGGARKWLERHAMTIAAVIVGLLAASLLRNGISGLTSLSRQMLSAPTRLGQASPPAGGRQRVVRSAVGRQRARAQKPK